MTTRLVLQCDRWRAEVAPAIGGSILSLTLDGVALLRPTPEAAVVDACVRRTACYPLLPYANRIAAGRFHAGGVEYTLRPNFAHSVHPLHGVGWRRPWRIAAAGDRFCELRLDHRPLDAERLDWPFAFDAVERIELAANGLCMRLGIVNRAATLAPLGFGLHPWFPRRPAATLAFESGGAWANDAGMLPAEQVSGGEWDHGRGLPIGLRSLDNDFFGWRGTADMTSPGRPVLRLQASPVFSVLRVFTPSDQPNFAVEPVTHAADSINRAPEAPGAMAWLAPGAALEGTVSLTMAPHSGPGEGP